MDQFKRNDSIFYAQWDKWDKTYDNHWCYFKINSSKGNEDSTLLRTGLSRAVCGLSIISSLKSLLSLVKIEKFSKDGE